MNQNIKFVRIKGRVIPIKVKGHENAPVAQKNHKPKKAVKFYDKASTQFGIFTGLGVGLSAIGGRASGIASKMAEDRHQRSFDFGMDKPFSSLPKGAKSAGHGMAQGRKLLKLSRKSRAGILLAGASLISLGVSKGFEAMGYDKPTLAQETAREVGALTASHLVMKGFEQGFTGIKSKAKFKIKIPITVKKVATDLASRFIKKQLRFKF